MTISSKFLGVFRGYFEEKKIVKKGRKIKFTIKSLHIPKFKPINPKYLKKCDAVYDDYCCNIGLGKHLEKKILNKYLDF